MVSKILVLAGGGGHTSIAVAVAQSLHGKVDINSLVPKKDLLSERLLRKYGEVSNVIKPRGPFTPNYLFVIRFFLSFIQSFTKVDTSYNLVVSSGSNFCIAPSIVAWLKKIPVINVESRVALIKPSKTAKILQKISIATILQWEEQKKNLKGIVVGPIFQKPEYQSSKKGYILVTGGTEGYRRLFNVFLESDFENIVLQTGKIESKQYKRKHPSWRVFNFSEDFQSILAGADIVITHQGGGTIFESVMYEKPLIIVFNPELKRTAKFEEIKILSEKIGASLITEVSLQKIKDEIYDVKYNFFPINYNGNINLRKIILKILDVI